MFQRQWAIRMGDITFCSAFALARAIQNREIGALEATEACIARIERFDDHLNAHCVTLFDEARNQARAADQALERGASLGPLHGVPITVKEANDVAGTATTWGLIERAAHLATEDSEVVRRLREAGAVLLGKTNVPVGCSDWQSANPLYGRTRNPWDLKRTPGGSSGGSAVSLAAGYAYLEAGSDIGGSLRNPAHFCGISAHKPTFGVVPDYGHSIPDPELSEDLAVVGPMARYVEDLELALALMVGPEPRDTRAWRIELPPPRAAHVSQLRVAVVREESVCRVSADVTGAVNAMADAFEAAGASVDHEAVLPVDSRASHRTYIQLLRAVGAAELAESNFARELRTAESATPEDNTLPVQVARAYTQRHRDWLGANAERMDLRRRWAAFFERYDVLLCPSAPTVAWPHDERERIERTIDVDGDHVSYYDQLFWSGITVVAYLPSTVVPAGLSAGGLPIGVQIVADYLEDRSALAAARWLEEATGGFVPPPNFAV